MVGGPLGEGPGRLAGDENGHDEALLSGGSAGRWYVPGVLEAAVGRSVNGLEYLRTGDGPPLVMSSGLASSNAIPTGTARRVALSAAAPYAAHFTVYLLNRRVGMPADSTMGSIAAEFADAIAEIGEPVLLHGTSTGGSVALQVAADRPELVRRLVIASSACRLSDHGQRVQARVARLLAEGQVREANAQLLRMVAAGPLQRPSGGLGWLLGPMLTPEVPPRDMITTITSEDVFDAEPYLDRIQAPTLVLGGGADPYYTADLFQRTADGVQDGRAVIYPGKGHLHPVGAKASATALGFLLG